jgi:hypothetical protein
MFYTSPKAQNALSCVTVLYWRVVLQKYASSEPARGARRSG